MSKELHVLLSAYACLPNAGTEPGNGWNWTVQLAERGIRVHVLTVTDGREQIEAFLAEHPLAGVTFTYIAVPSSFRNATVMHYLRWQWASVQVARELHKNSPFDLVHHITYSSIHVPTQLWRLGVPTIFGPVGGAQIAPKSMLDEFGSSRNAEVARTALTRALPFSILHRIWLRKMAIVLTTNSDTLRLAKRMTRTPVEPWFDAALPKSFFLREPRTFTSDSRPLRLLWVGRMVPRKALPLTLKIVAKVKHPATLTIVGNGLLPSEVQAMIDAADLDGRAHWAGRRLDRSEIRQAYLEHDVLVFPSLRDSCPAQLVEAMGLGLPVITLDHHGAADLVPDGAGIKVPVTTPDGVATDMAAAVDRYATLTNEERTAMSKVGWSFARTLNYTDGAELFEALYRQILARSAVLTALPQNAKRISTKLT